MDFKYAENPIPLEEVESVEEIVKSILRQVRCLMVLFLRKHMRHLAIAMNHLHGKSNTGEGGESNERLDSAGTK